DSWHGRTFVSVVGFQFLRTRVLGVPIPFHRHFEEVNLRFYVRHKNEGEWRRGVVFVQELVPKRAIALIANQVYGENYRALPMRHDVEFSQGAGSNRVSYEWRHDVRWEGVSATFSGSPVLPEDDAEEAFITEHYWGYAQQPNHSAVEYQVEHPRWRVWRAETASLECDVSSLYGPEFRDALSGPPSSAFVADGSPVVVRRGRLPK
ncbi:MAG: DUF2071 domain-containing protein, partial [Myxococcales bacterium]|nr:DUF2071 domain-containing protein [Myxococcales bacterium]